MRMLKLRPSLRPVRGRGSPGLRLPVETVLRLYVAGAIGKDMRGTGRVVRHRSPSRGIGLGG